MIHHGYLRVDQVAEPGEFAVRGAVLDRLSYRRTEQPVRIDFLDDEIESLRTVRPGDAAQPRRRRTHHDPAGTRVSVRRLPRYKAFRERYREHFPVEPGRSPIYRIISEAQLPAGIEYYLPLFFSTTCSLLDYLAPSTLLVVELDDALDGLDNAWQLVEERYEQLRGDHRAAAARARGGFWEPSELAARLARATDADARRSRAELEPGRYCAYRQRGNGASARCAGRRRDVDRSRALAREHDADERTLLVTSSPGHREVMLEFLQEPRP